MTTNTTETDEIINKNTIYEIDTNDIIINNNFNDNIIYESNTNENIYKINTNDEFVFHLSLSHRNDCPKRLHDLFIQSICT